MTGTIYYNGTSSDDFGLIVEKLPPSVHASRRGDLISIPGRNGVIVREDGSFNTYEQEYQISFSQAAQNRDPYQTARDIAVWLLGSRGFCRLEDIFEPEYFRLARYSGAFDVGTMLMKYGKATLTFDVQPQRYLKSGESEIMIESNASGSSSIEINNIAKNAKRVKLNVSQDASIEPCVGSLKIYKSDNPSDYISATMTEIVAPDDFVYTNVMDNSGAQFKAGLRYSKGSAAFVSNNDPACDAVVIPIPSNVSDIRIRVKNATFSAYNTIYGGTNGRTFPTDYGRYQVNPSPLQDENGDVYFDFTNTGSSYITFNLAPVSDPSALIVTVNEPIVKINADGVAEYKGSLLMTAGYDSAVAAINEQGNPNARLITIDANGNEINAVAMRSGQAVIVNPTQFEARPLLKFVDTSEQPQPQTVQLTMRNNVIVDWNGEVTEVAETIGPMYRASVTVDVEGYEKAIISGNGYTFLDGNYKPVGKNYRETDENKRFTNLVRLVPSSAKYIVVSDYGGEYAALQLVAFRPNPGVSAAVINGTTINLDFSKYDTIYLDCDLHDAYYIDGSSANSAVTFESNVDDYPTFPGLSPGENHVTSGDGENLDFKLVPRWWTL